MDLTSTLSAVVAILLMVMDLGFVLLQVLLTAMYVTDLVYESRCRW